MSILLSIPSYIFSLVPPLPYFSPPRPASNQQEPLLPAESDFNSFTTIFNPETLTEKGLHRVGSLEHEGDIDGEHELYYELHGQGKEKVLFIMGLNNSSFSWNKQVDLFGSHPSHQVLVFDNRGAGWSTPGTSGPYRTSDMARDALSLLDRVGWTEEKQVHVVGISMGGMIALELASRAPERLASLTLAVTSSGHGFMRNLPPWTGLTTLARLLRVTAPEDRVNLAIEMLFPKAFLDAVDPDDTHGRTGRETRIEEYMRRFNLTRRQPLSGNLGQSAAALTHHVAPERLAEIDRNVPKILILVGDEDNLVAVENSFYLKEKMPHAELVQWEGTGHAIHSQHPKRFNSLVSRVWEEGRSRVETGPTGERVQAQATLI